MKTRITFSFKSKKQMPLFMVIKEYYDDDGNIEFAKVLFEIKGRKMRKLEKMLFEKKTQTKKRYALTLCARTDYEQVVYAHLSKDDIYAIERSILGELNGQHVITLDDGETIDIEIVDYIEEVKQYAL